jgi:hypothetical protein
VSLALLAPKQAIRALWQVNPGEIKRSEKDAPVAAEAKAKGK